MHWPGEVDPVTLESVVSPEEESEFHEMIRQFDGLQRSAEENTEIKSRVSTLVWVSADAEMDVRYFNSHTALVEVEGYYPDHMEALVVLEKVDDTWVVRRWYVTATA